MLKLKIAGLLGAVAVTAGLAFALVPAASADIAEPVSGCADLLATGITYNTAAIDANLRHDTEAALDANQDVQGYALSALVACLTRGLNPSLSILAGTLSNAQAMTANDRGPSGEGAALAAERKTDLALRAALKAVGGR